MVVELIVHGELGLKKVEKFNFKRELFNLALILWINFVSVVNLFDWVLSQI